MRTIKPTRTMTAAVLAAGCLGLAGAPAMAQQTSAAASGAATKPKAFPLSVAAKTWTVAAGGTLVLDGDLALSGDDALEINGTAEKPCTLVGNGHQIKTKGNWTGHVTATHCTFKQLGKTQAVIKVPNPGTWPGFKIDDPDVPAFVMTGQRAADWTFQDCTFDQCSFLVFNANGQSTLAFRHNTVLANALFPVSEQPAASRPCINVSGSSTAKKFFQGNRVYKGECCFQAANAMIGGDRDAESNVIIGLRAKIRASGRGTVIRGNYVHVLLPGSDISPHFAYWSQVSTFEPGDTLAEHNVIRDGEWIVRFVEGEFRYNLICDINDHDLCQNGSIGKIHHNIFFGSKPNHAQGSMGGCIAIVYKPKTPGGGVEIYNNTFDGCGRLAVPAVEVGKEGFVKTFRNNVAFNFALGEKFGKGPAAMVRPNFFEEFSAPLPERMGYADYNLFYNPKSKSTMNYALGVAGKTLRKDAGFALNDVERGGAVDQQVDPRFAGPLPTAFPFKDEDIQSGKVTVSQMLAQFRRAYTPAAGSPLVAAGDPADGDGADIGAIGAGKPHKDDCFGRLAARPGKQGERRPPHAPGAAAGSQQGQ